MSEPGFGGIIGLEERTSYKSHQSPQIQVLTFEPLCHRGSKQKEKNFRKRLIFPRHSHNMRAHSHQVIIRFNQGYYPL